MMWAAKHISRLRVPTQRHCTAARLCMSTNLASRSIPHCYLTLLAQSHLHCRTLAFAFSQVGYKIDLYIAIFVQRLFMLRRIVLKYPHCLLTLRRLAQLYRSRGLHGA